MKVNFYEHMNIYFTVVGLVLALTCAGAGFLIYKSGDFNRQTIPFAEYNMNDIENSELKETETIRKIKELIDLSLITQSDIKREEFLKTAAEILSTQPNVIPSFIEFFILTTDNEWYMNYGLNIMLQVGKTRFYDTSKLVNMITNKRYHLCYRLDAARCIAIMADSIDEHVISGLITRADNEISEYIVCFTLGSIAEISDRKKAGRILRKCLEPTANATSRNTGALLDSFVQSIEKNEDIYSGSLNENLKAHEIVIISVSLLKETWPNGSQLRRIAEEASKSSALAKSFLDSYLSDLQ